MKFILKKNIPFKREHDRAPNVIVDVSTFGRMKKSITEFSKFFVKLYLPDFIEEASERNIPSFS